MGKFAVFIERPKAKNVFQPQMVLPTPLHPVDVSRPQAELRFEGPKMRPQADTVTKIKRTGRSLSACVIY